MTPPRLVALADVAPAPWKNGGGVTRELLAWPAEGAWKVRVSVASIDADGPFSAFPGVDRWFAVLAGGGVALTVDGVERHCRAGDPPLAFAGDAAVDCRLLDGPSRDLNLMLRGCPGAMRPAVAREAWTPRARRCGVYAVVTGRCVAGGAETSVPAATLAWFDEAPPSLVFRPDPTSANLRVPAWWLAAGAEEPAA
jgi:environmental stress-induced protein Ves